MVHQIVKPLIAIALFSLAAVTHSPRQQPSPNRPMWVVKKPAVSLPMPPQPTLVVRRSSVALPPMTNGQPYCVTNRFGVHCFIYSNVPPLYPTLDATFAPTRMTNLTAYVQTASNLTGPWRMLWQTNYPANGGTLTVPVPTNGAGWQRAGYSIP